MLSKVKLANRSFSRNQRRKKKLANRNKNESYEQYETRKRREQKANHRQKRYDETGL